MINYPHANNERSTNQSCGDDRGAVIDRGGGRDGEDKGYHSSNIKSNKEGGCTAFYISYNFYQ